ncbi:uncharacterized, partial [Tachysurus ichikawai]
PTGMMASWADDTGTPRPWSGFQARLPGALTILCSSRVPHSWL